MATEGKHGTDQCVPDPATVYGREKPEAESGMGELVHRRSRSPRCADRMDHAVGNKQPIRQINAEEEDDLQPRPCAQLPLPEPADHTMLDEEPTS